jgi:UvrD/REP helicase N-terminal domain/UvrD-like helicase C-terminal domain
MSFTNVAWQEIEAYLSKDFCYPTPIKHPHFLGTIDSFINTYIFLPFGHLVMNCTGRPELTGPPHDDTEPIGSWLFWGRGHAECHKKGCKLNDFSFDIDGELKHLRQKTCLDNCSEVNKPCIANKRRFNLLGRATQSDANYFAMKILEDHPTIAEALANRFPVVMVDEAQDTSRIQMRILDILAEKGVSEMMLVGDPDQAIYEWRDAEPALFTEKFEQWRENSVELSENWRSTPAICRAASRLSSGTDMTGCNPELSESGISPEVWGYSNTSEFPSVLNRFKEMCSRNGIEGEGTHVLTRGASLLNELVPGSSRHGPLPWRPGDFVSRGLARSRFLFDASRKAEALKAIERTLCRHLKDGAPFSSADLDAIREEIGFVTWRARLYGILASLPPARGCLAEWASDATRTLADTEVGNELTVSIKRDSGRNRYSRLDFSDIFATPELSQPDRDCVLGTVHSAKGKTLEAVLLVLRQKAGNGPYYRTLLSRNLQEHEELRIAYVGITRPRRILVLTVPERDVNAWQNKLGIDSGERSGGS